MNFEHSYTEESEKEDDIFSLFGAWQSNKSGEEIISDIYNARNDASDDSAFCDLFFNQTENLF